MELRKMYAAELSRLMKQNDKIVILDADLAGAVGTKPLYQEFPDRCIDCGIAEANMACIAAGLSAQGFVPFIHSFAPFVARRGAGYCGRRSARQSIALRCGAQRADVFASYA